MDNSIQAINDLVLDLSLASAMPIGVDGISFVKATSSANALVCRTLNMTPKELRELEYTVGPLLTLLTLDVDSPVAEKAAYGLRSLMPSRVCMKEFMRLNGLQTIAKVFDTFLGNKKVDLQSQSVQKLIVEHLAAVYRDVGMFFAWKIVNVGAIRHCVFMLRFGDINIKVISAGTLATLCNDLEICKLMFNNGAVKPLLNVSDGDITNAACMLAGLGCVTQLCRIPEIGIRVVTQGAVPLLEKSIHRNVGHSIKSIREKALLSLAWLSRIPAIKRDICTPEILRGMKREIEFGTMESRFTIVQMLLNLHNQYDTEQEFVSSIIDTILELLNTGPWHARNLCAKAACVLYGRDQDKLYLIKHGCYESLVNIIEQKTKELQEAPLVAILSFCTQPDIPKILIERGAAAVVATLLYAVDDVIKDLAVVLLKVFILYNRDVVANVVPSDRAFLLAKADEHEPGLYGCEYSGLIEEYLQRIVENRRDMSYLMEQIDDEFIQEMGLTEEELEVYQNTFIELDYDCRGFMGTDEMKVMMVMMGEELDKDELDDVIKEYDTDGSGVIDFKEFVNMMKSWKEKFGTGAARAYNVATKRGAIGKARKEMAEWMDQEAADKAEIQAGRDRKIQKQKEIAILALKFQTNEKIKNARKQETLRRQYLLDKKRRKEEQRLEEIAYLQAKSSNSSLQ